MVKENLLVSRVRRYGRQLRRSVGGAPETPPLVDSVGQTSGNTDASMWTQHTPSRVDSLHKKGPVSPTPLSNFLCQEKLSM